jgi:hypothetical protein
LAFSRIYGVRPQLAGCGVDGRSAVSRAAALGLLPQVLLRHGSQQGDEHAESSEDVDDREDPCSVAGRREVLIQAFFCGPALALLFVFPATSGDLRGGQRCRAFGSRTSAASTTSGA